MLQRPAGCGSPIGCFLVFTSVRKFLPRSAICCCDDVHKLECLAAHGCEVGEDVVTFVMFRTGGGDGSQEIMDLLLVRQETTGVRIHQDPSQFIPAVHTSTGGKSSYLCKPIVERLTVDGTMTFFKEFLQQQKEHFNSL